MRRSTVLALATFLFAAGCVQPDAPSDPVPDMPAPTKPALVPPAPEYDFSKAVDPDHAAHDVGLLHEAGHGLQLVGHTGVGSILAPGMRGSITQIDVHNGTAVVAGMQQGAAFILVDVSDPTMPKPLSYVRSPADGWTARFSHDGNYVFYGCQLFGAPYEPQATIQGDCRDPQSLHTEPADAGISVYDVSDRTNPKFVDFMPVPGSHNIQSAWIDGTDYIVTASTAILKFDRAAGKLGLVSSVPGTHDATVVRHPVTGNHLLYTGAGQLAIYDIDEPTHPVEVLPAGEFKGGVGWHDQVAFPQLVDGRALLALAGEQFTNAQSQAMDVVTIVDITDPAKPAVLGTWTPPFTPKAPWVSYTFSVHEMAATPQGQLAVSWYHGGVWVIDLSTKERQEQPVVLAAYQPNKEINVVPATFAQTAKPLVPFVWSAAWDQRGYLLVPDMHTGVYVLEPDWGLHPVEDSGA